MIPDGVYLNLPNEIYQEDPALGSGDHKAILCNAVQWHARKRNETFRQLVEDTKTADELTKESAAKRFGSALHCMVIEPDEFDDRYCLEPERPDGLLSTKEDMTAVLNAIGVATKSTFKRDDLVALCRMKGLRLVDDWAAERDMLAGGREIISRRWELQLRLLRRTLDAHSYAMSFLRNGRAEVSVFWTDEYGVRLKVRFDYLRTRTVADVKTYAFREGAEAIDSFVSQSDAYAYDLQAAHYMDARMNALPALVEAGHVYDARGYPHGGATVQEALDMRGELLRPNETDLEFFQKVADFKEPRWWWIACMTQGAPEVDTIEFDMRLLRFLAAQTQVQLARQKYRDMRDKFGDNSDSWWAEDRGLIRLTEHNFSNGRAADRGAIKWEPISE